MNVHSFLPLSYANGPGRRAVIWMQGCTLNCPGCFNPTTHPHRAGLEISVEALFERIHTTGDRIEGITLSGGEPLQQMNPVIELLSRIRAETHLSVLIFSGYRLEEIERMRLGSELLDLIDVLVAGRYDRSLPAGKKMLGSANQKIHMLSPRYTLEDLADVPPAEVQISPSGEIILSGIHPLDLPD